MLLMFQKIMAILISRGSAVSNSDEGKNKNSVTKVHFFAIQGSYNRVQKQEVKQYIIRHS